MTIEKLPSYVSMEDSSKFTNAAMVVGVSRGAADVPRVLLQLSGAIPFRPVENEWYEASKPVMDRYLVEQEDGSLTTEDAKAFEAKWKLSR